MSRRPVRRATGGMSLFPFLAVLICTMGALVGLLMLMIASASAQAASVRVAIDEQLASEDEAVTAPAVVAPSFENQADDEKAYQAQVAIEDAAWRKDMLLKQREELTRQLSERRNEVGYLEQTLRTLQSQADGLLAQAKALQEDGGDAEALKKQLAEMERRIAEETAKLDAAKAAQAAAPTSYAITPYDGPTGTHRRPMFIECTGEAVVLQPEGIVLSQQDFAGPLFPGNPLDAALRAQEYLQTHGGESVHGSAYPLFVVREEGAVAYSVARSSMKSWENEFGYELIPNDMKLAFPPVDPGLAAVMQQAVEDARQRQLALAAAQPSRFAGANGGGRVLHATPRGGFVAAGGHSPSGKSGNTFGAGTPDKPIADSSGTGTEGPTNAKNISEEKSKSPGAKPGSTGGSGGAAPKGSEHDDRPIAEKEGEGWAVPEADAFTTPLERPIRVAIEADRILIVAETMSGKESTQIALTPRTSDAVGPLVGGVQERIKSWGFAGKGFYWRPRMVVEVRPGGERRFAEIGRLLENSGIVLEAAKP